MLEETGLLPHLNPRVLRWEDFQRLKPVAPSLGMMLETTADVPAHAGSPDKVPAVRLRVLEDAGVVTSEKHGRVRTVSLRPGALDVLHLWLGEQRTPAEHQADRLGIHLARTASKET